MTRSEPGILGRTFWNLYARIYDTLLVFRPYNDMLEGAQQSVGLAPGSQVLDAGCGTGNLTRCLVKQGYAVTGLDSSGSMLDRARHKCPGACFVQADLGQPLPFEAHTFDALTCSNVLYTLSDPQATLREFRRLLRPGGTLVITNPVPGCSTYKILGQHWRDASLAGRCALLLALPQILLLLAFNRFLLTPDRRSRLFLPGSAELERNLREQGLTEVRVSPSYARQSWLVAALAGSPCPS